MKERVAEFARMLSAKVGAVLNTPRRRIIAGILAVLVVAGVTVPPVAIYMNDRRYDLSPEAVRLLGPVSEYLSKKLTYDDATQTYYLNRQGIVESDLPLAGSNPQQVAQTLQQRVGGGNSKASADDLLYSAKLPADPESGVTYYDNSLHLSFTLKPDFELRKGKERDGRIVYPYGNDAQLVYSPKGNGIKEDLVLKRPAEDELNLRYRIELPDTLEARMLPDGSGAVGIYSADPSLFGNVTYGSDADVEKIESARRSAKKDNVAFTLPAPRLVSEGNLGQAAGQFILSTDGRTLTVSLTGLAHASYPITIDPSVVVSSTSEFATAAGDQENIDYSTSGQAGRGGITGGSLGGWSGTTGFTGIRQAPTTVVYNGYMYVIGGYDSSFFNTVQYAPINSDGTVGSWNSTSTFSTARDRHASVAYNGYMYIIGGNNLNPISNVQVARINSNGTLGPWQDTTSLPSARLDLAAAAYNGYVYAIGGNNSNVFTSGQLNDVLYAPVNANGSLGSWTSTTGFTNARQAHTSIAYNGNLYVMGGFYSNTVHNDVQYAPISTNGTVGSWTSTSAFATARYFHASAVYNGYLYIFGGSTGVYANDVQYASVNANGSVNPWTTTTSFSTGRWRLTAAAYNGYVYVLAGYDGGVYHSDVQRAKINPPGVTTAYGTTTNLTSTRSDNAVVAYNGYLYTLGGGGSQLLDTVEYTAIGADGTIGTWNSASSFTTTRYSPAAVAYNGYMYILGGDGTGGPYNDVQYAPINANGSLGTWNPTTSFPTARAYFGAAAYNGYMYVAGGLWQNGASPDVLSTVHYAQIKSDGTLDTWNSTNAFMVARYSHAVIAYGGYLYILGGNNGSNNQSTVQYAPISSNGTVGTWTYTASMNALRTGHAAAVYNGYLYVLGGGDTGYYNSVESSPISANGTIGTWVNGPSFTNARAYLGATAYRGYMYILGGYNGSTEYDDVQYARINNGGQGSISSWGSTNGFTTGRYLHVSVAYNGYMYVIGGYGSGYLNDVQYAPINSDGTVGSWTPTASFTLGRWGITAVAYRGYLYVLGGQNLGVSPYYFDDVQYAPINSNGSIGSWNTTTSFTTGRNNHTTVVYNGYMYIAGGSGQSTYNDVQYAPVNANGTLGTWTSTASFNGVRNGQASVVYNGFMYILGGNGYTNDVQYAQMNSDGTLGTWKYTSGFVTGRSNASAAVANGYLYILGGSTGSGYLDDVQYAPINANGTLGQWVVTTSFTTQRTEFSSLVTGGRLYILGGLGGFALNDVRYAPLNAISRVARYSSLVALRSSGTVTNVSYNGKLAGGVRDIQYRMANASGVFAGSQSANGLPGGTTYDCAGSTSAAVAYVQVFVTLDDSQSATFPDASGTTNAHLTDVTVDYTSTQPDPSVRMRGGKYFSTDTQVQQGLDTCRLGYFQTMLPTTTVQDGSGSYSYYFPNGMQQVGGEFTTGALNSSSVTRFNYLDHSVFGYSVPTNATITGVAAEIFKRSTQNVGNTRYITDHTVQLIKAGTAQGTNKADTTTHWSATGSFYSITYGGNNDLWGLALTPADVNAGNFGIRFTAQGKDSSGGTTSAEMDYVKLTVYYTVP